MKIRTNQRRLYQQLVLCVALALSLTTASLLPLLTPRSASAAQITSRSLTLSSAVPANSSAQYTFTFTVASTTQVQGLKFQTCTTAVGTCNGTAGTDVPNFGSRTFGTQSGWQGGTSFAVDTTGANDCTPSTTVICANRSDVTAQTATSRSIRFDAIINPSTANTSFFVRITTYSTTNYTGGGIVDTGTTASAVTQTLSVNAAVAEVLNFCVGSTTVDDATTSIAGDCTGVGGTSLNIGTLDTSQVNVSPVNTNNGDNKNGVAMLRTNALNGATVSYDAIQQSGTNHKGTLRISGANCNAGNVNTDQCIDGAGAVQTAFSAGTEMFGMSIGAVNCGSATAYTCTFAAGSYNLTRDANYDCTGNNTFATTCSQGYAWVESGTVTQIASSASSSVKQVDDEALLLKFAATPAITTPFGSYAAQSDFIAIATY